MHNRSPSDRLSVSTCLWSLRVKSSESRVFYLWLIILPRDCTSSQLPEAPARNSRNITRLSIHRNPRNGWSRDPEGARRKRSCDVNGFVFSPCISPNMHSGSQTERISILRLALQEKGVVDSGHYGPDALSSVNTVQTLDLPETASQDTRPAVDYEGEGIHL